MIYIAVLEKLIFFLLTKVFIKISDRLRILEFMKKGKASVFTDTSSCNALQGGAIMICTEFIEKLLRNWLN